MDDFIKAMMAIVGGAFTLAIISVLVSRQAQTPQVIGASGNALATVISAATNPVTMNNPTNLGANAYSSPGGGIGSRDILNAAMQVVPYLI